MQTAETIYEIPYKNCPKTCGGNGAFIQKTRLSEHKYETEKLAVTNLTSEHKKGLPQAKSTNQRSLST